MKYLVYRTDQSITQQIKETKKDGHASYSKFSLYNTEQQAIDKAKEWAGAYDDSRTAFVAELKNSYRKVPAEIQVEEVNNAD